MKLPTAHETKDILDYLFVRKIGLRTLLSWIIVVYTSNFKHVRSGFSFLNQSDSITIFDNFNEFAM